MIIFIFYSMTAPDHLIDSMGDRTAEKSLISDLEREDKMLALTIWSSTTSTFTDTSTSTNTATTYSVSFYCSVVGAPFPPACG